MTKRKLTIVRIALVAVLAMSVLFGLVACGSKVNGISIGRNDMPKLTYVEGQDCPQANSPLITAEKRKRFRSIRIKFPCPVTIKPKRASRR